MGQHEDVMVTETFLGVPGPACLRTLKIKHLLSH